MWICVVMGGGGGGAGGATWPAESTDSPRATSFRLSFFIMREGPSADCPMASTSFDHRTQTHNHPTTHELAQVS